VYLKFAKQISREICLHFTVINDSAKSSVQIDVQYSRKRFLLL